MPLPLIPLIIGSAMAVGAGANIYSQTKQRQLYRYQKQGYERQLADWHKNIPGRTIRYPELSYPGRIRALDTGISQSYASSVGSFASFAGNSVGNYAISKQFYSGSRSSGLYHHSAGHSSRWL